MRKAIFFFLLLQVSCIGKDKGNQIKKFNLVNEYKLNLDKYTSPVEEYIQHIPNWKGKEVFAIHVRKMFEIKLFDLESGEILENLSYSPEGPKSYPNIYGFHIHDENEIFLNMKYNYKTHLVNEHFDLIKTFEFLDPGTKVDPNSGIPLSGDTYLPIFNHNKIFKKFSDRFIFTASPDISAYNPKGFNVDCMLIEVNVESGQKKRLIGFQDNMIGKAWGPLHSYLHTDYSESGNQFCLSYAGDEQLYIAKENLEILSSFPAKPNKYKPIKAIPIAAINNDAAYLSHSNEQFIFGSALYDEFRDLIYRIALEPNPNYGDIYIKDPLYEPRNLIVMAFDSNYEKVAEMRLEQSSEGTYLDRCFVNKNGLNISYVDLKNEDKLYFKTFLVE